MLVVWIEEGLFGLGIMAWQGEPRGTTEWGQPHSCGGLFLCDTEQSIRCVGTHKTQADTLLSMCECEAWRHDRQLRK